MQAMNIQAKSTTRTLEIGGMTCASCVAHVEKALKTAPGVLDARVNLATQRAELDLAPGADLAALAQRVKDEGYEPRTKKFEIGVNGMMCGACVAHVEKALKKLPGVLSANANLATHRATIETLAGAVDYATLAAAIRAEDYEPTPIEAQGDALADRDKDSARLKRDFWLAAAGSAPVVALEMGAHLSPGFALWSQHTLGRQPLMLLAAALTTFVLAVPGRRFFLLGFGSLKRGAPDMNALVALGAGAAYLYSVLATFAPNILPEGARHSYFEFGGGHRRLHPAGAFAGLARGQGRGGSHLRTSRLQPNIAHIRRDGENPRLARRGNRSRLPRGNPPRRIDTRRWRGGRGLQPRRRTLMTGEGVSRREKLGRKTGRRRPSTRPVFC